MVRNFLLLFAAVFLGCALLQLNSNPLRAMDQSGCEKDCYKCHTISNEEIKDILKKLRAPDAEILSVQDSPLKGLWEVSIVNKGKPGLFYVDYSKGFVVSGSIVEVKSGKNKTAEHMARLQESRRVDFSKIPLNQALILGDPAAPKKVAVFTDPDCPYCGTLHQEMEKVVKEKKDVVFYILLYPLSFHKDAYWKSKSIMCNRSLKMLEDAFAKKEIPRLECDSKEIDSNIKVAESLGITGTPTLVLPDGRVNTGMLPAKKLIDFINGVPKAESKAK
ncbi:MAG: DsbC family protein [Syntrophaceae bacterium]|jgi:thiol:disulfide interchange protein DsbC|nr:DsbC family protein [Syntrophaceae bacterium]